MAEARSRSVDSWSVIAAKFVLISISLLVAFLAVAYLFEPHTAKGWARFYARQCIREKGYGEWYGSSGITLEKFCEGVGDLKALDEDRRDNPENY